jgi:hypothetical protein
VPTRREEGDGNKGEGGEQQGATEDSTNELHGFKKSAGRVFHVKGG